MNTKSCKTRLYLSLKWFILCLFLLSSATWALGLSNLKYHTESALEFASGFPGPSSNWRISGNQADFSIGPDSIAFSSSTPGMSEALYDFRLDGHAQPAGSVLRGRSTVSHGAHTPADTNNFASILLRFFDKDGKRLLTRRLHQISSSPPVASADYVFRVPTQTRLLRVGIRDKDSGLEYSLDSVELDIVTIAPIYRFLAAVLVFCWLLLTGAAVVWIIKRQAIISLFLIAGTLGLLSTGMLLPKSYLLSLAQLGGVVSGEKEAMEIVYNGAHFFLFTILALFTLILFRGQKSGQLTAAIILVTIAVATEGFQLHFNGRSASTHDLLFDMAGIATGYLAYQLYLLLGKTARLQVQGPRND